MNNLEKRARKSEIRKRKKILKKELAPQYEKIKEGIKRCTICGLALTEEEENFHEVIHDSFIRAKLEHGNNILLYKELKEEEKRLKELFDIYKNSNTKKRKIYLPIILDRIYLIQYNYSQRFWDYGREHPILNDYIYLLWNTEEFIKKMSLYFPDNINIILSKKDEYTANRKLKTSRELFKDSFIFIKAENTGIEDRKNLSYLDAITQRAKEPLDIPNIEDETGKDFFDEENLFEELIKKAI